MAVTTVCSAGHLSRLIVCGCTLPRATTTEIQHRLAASNVPLSSAALSRSRRHLEMLGKARVEARATAFLSAPARCLSLGSGKSGVCRR